ncbi:MAG: prolyl oligopeptidase family serine peptidase, partial [Candidatus Dormibacteria bacterium]
QRRRMTDTNTQAMELNMATETILGVLFEDPFVALNQDSAETLRWQQEQDTAALEYLNGCDVELVAKAIDRYRALDGVIAPVLSGRRWCTIVPSLEDRTDTLQISDAIGEPGDLVALDHKGPVPDLARAVMRQLLESDPQLLGPLAQGAPEIAAASWRDLKAELVGGEIDGCLEIPGGIQLEVALRSGSASLGVRLNSSGVPTGASTSAGPRRVVALEPSPDGKLVVVEIATMLVGGLPGNGLVLVVDVQAARVLERVPAGPLGAVAWLRDSRSFVVGAWDLVTDQPALLTHRVGDAVDHVDFLPAGSPGNMPWTSADGRWLGVSSGTGYRDRALHLVRDLNESAVEWRPFLPDLKGHCLGTFIGDQYVVISETGSPRGRLVGIPITSPEDPGTWVDLVPERDEVLRAVARIGDHLVLTYIEGGERFLRIHSMGGDFKYEIRTPSPGTITARLQLDGVGMADGLVQGGFGDRVTFVHQSPISSSAIYDLDLSIGSLQRRTVPARSVDDAVVRKVSCLAGDGIPLMMEVAHRTDLDWSVPHPAVAIGYGSLGLPLPAGYAPMFAALIEAGGVYVMVHPRGGGEYGVEAAALATQRRVLTVDDTVAMLNALVNTGITSSAHVGFIGASAGGYLAAALVARAPQALGAAVAMVPVTDPLLFYREAGMDALGGTATVEAVKDLRESSPYHNIPPNTKSPAVLVGCGSRDEGCRPAHGRKFVAALIRSDTGSRAHLLRIWDGPHELGLELSLESGGANQVAPECLAFLMNELGLTIPRAWAMLSALQGGHGL